jgi:hypothetical protein
LSRSHPEFRFKERFGVGWPKRIQTFLVPTSSCEQRPIKAPDVVFDEVFDKWLSSLPDLDAIDKEKRRAEGKLHWWED